MKKNHTKTKRSRRKQHKHYPVEIFALILMMVMFVEGAMFGVANTSSASGAVSVLDISQGVRETQEGLAMLAEPLVRVAVGVNEFYRLAAQETIKLLENNFADHAIVTIQTIFDFYDSASKELASTLDFSPQFSTASAHGY